MCVFFIWERKTKNYGINCFISPLNIEKVIFKKLLRLLSGDLQFLPSLYVSSSFLQYVIFILFSPQIKVKVRNKNHQHLFTGKKKKIILGIFLIPKYLR